jgi:hypothetical protein
MAPALRNRVATRSRSRLFGSFDSFDSFDLTVTVAPVIELIESAVHPSHKYE